MIWSASNFNVVASKVSETRPIIGTILFRLINNYFDILVQWSEVRKSGKHPSYVLITATATNVNVNLLEFDLGSMQYSLKVSAIQLPSSGIYSISVLTHLKLL